MTSFSNQINEYTSKILQFLNLSPMVGSALKSKQVRAKEMKYD
jgi:hypothetical protein